jgi:hypothetical protein
MKLNYRQTAVSNNSRITDRTTDISKHFTISTKIGLY